ncbi:aliphatic sulfonate ABC transporter substrate-binding protein [soil metagenome]
MSVRPHQRGWAAVAAVAAVAIALTGCAASPAPETDETGEAREVLDLNVGYIDTSINGVGIIAAANELGLWEKAGLNVTLTPFTNGPTQITAMQADQIDVGYIGGGATWLPATGNAVIIAPSEMSQGDVVLAQAGSGIKDPEDLAGKKVGVPEGGSGEMILSLTLEAAGLTADDIEKVVLDPPSVVSAFVSGQIDVAAIFSPLSNQIMESLPDTVTVANNASFPDTQFLGSWVASNSAVEDKQEALERFLEVYIQANDYRIENTQEVVDWASAASGAPADQLAGQAKISIWTPSVEIEANNQDGKTFDQFASLIDVFVKIGRMDAKTDPKDFVNIDMFSTALANLQ